MGEALALVDGVALAVGVGVGITFSFGFGAGVGFPKTASGLVQVTRSSGM